MQERYHKFEPINVTLHTFNGKRETLKLSDGSLMEILTGPYRKNQKAHEEANTNTNGYSIESLMCNLNHSVNSIT